MINIDRPESEKVLRYVMQGGAPGPKSNRVAAIFFRVIRALVLSRKAQPIASAPDRFKGCSGHPDSRQRFWELGEALPHECRVVLFGRQPALGAGAKTSDPGYTWTDTKRDLGDDWVIAPWPFKGEETASEETAWVKAAFEWFGGEAPSSGIAAGTKSNRLA